MHRSTFALATLIAMAACSKPADKTAQAADSTAAPAAALSTNGHAAGPKQMDDLVRTITDQVMAALAGAG